MFALFKFYVLLVRDLNLSVDTIRNDRFVRERGFREGGFNYNREESCPRWTGRKKNILARIADNIAWTLEYNQLNGWNLFSFLTISFILVTRNTLSVLFILRPKERDPVTNKFADPILNYMESIYLFDLLNKTDQSGMLHRLSLLILGSLILQRVSAFRLRYRGAQRNRHRYIKLNVVQLNVSQFLGLKSTLMGWFRVIYWGLTHQCNRRYSLRDGRAQKIKKIHMNLIKLERIDRFYYFNQLDFNDCYKEIEVDLKYAQDERFFVARPSHRIDPNCLALTSLSYIIGFCIVWSAVVFNTLGLCWPDIEASGYSLSRPLSSIWPTLIKYFSQIENVACFLQMLIVSVAIGINIFDLMLLIQSSLCELSRSRMVREMLEVEVDIYRSYCRSFIKFLDDNNLAIRTEDYVKEQLPMIEMQKKRSFFDRFWWASGGNQSQIDQSAGSRHDRAIASTNPNVIYKDYNHLLKEFKMLRIRRADEEMMSSNIRYLLDLTTMLQSEQTDLKDYFTWNLNLSILSGTLGLSIASILMVEFKNMQYFIVCFNFAITLVVTLAISLFMGATSEHGFRQIHKTLKPLMVNELEIVHLSVVQELQKVYGHLSAIEGRSFVLLGNIPLTFGSLASVSKSMHRVRPG